MTDRQGRLARIGPTFRKRAPFKRASRRLSVALVSTVAVATTAAMVVLSPVHIAASAWLSTAALAVHSPEGFRRSRTRIWRAYGWASLLSGVVATIADIGLVPHDLAREVVVVVIMMSAARLHAPVVCVPFAIGTGDQVAMSSWLVFAGATAVYLIALGVWGRWLEIAAKTRRA